MPQDPQASIANELPSIITITQNGWSPVLALKDRENEDLTISKVFQVINWVGGIAKKPAIGAYIGANGLVSNIADAVDIKGDPGVVQITVAELRDINAINSFTYYVTDLNSFFIVDADDTTSPDDGKFTIVSNNDKRIKKKVTGSPILIDTSADFSKIDSFNASSAILTTDIGSGIFNWGESGVEDGVNIFEGLSGYWVRIASIEFSNDIFDI